MNSLQHSIDMYATDGERKHAEALVRELIVAQDFKVSVSDGEEWTVINSSDVLFVLSALATTGEDYLKVIKDDVVSIIYLVFGNAEDGSELVADYSFGTDHALKVMTALTDKVHDSLY